MKTFVAMISFVFLVASTAAAYDVVGNVTVYKVKAVEDSRDSDTVYVSVMADVSNYGPPSKVFVVVAAVDRSGFEIESIPLGGVVLDTRENRTFTQRYFLPDRSYSKIKDWIVKEIRSFKP